MKKGILLLSAVALVGCGGGGSSSKSPESVPVPSNDVTLYTNLSGNGSITPTQITVEKGKSVTFEITPDQGHNLEEISGCNGQINGQNYLVENVSEKCTVSVEFSPEQYLVTTNIGAQGSAVLERGEVSHGESTFVDIFPHTDHRIGDAFGCDGTLTNERYNTGKIHGDCRVNVAFEPLHPAPELPTTRVRIPIVVHVFETGLHFVTDEQIKAQIAQTNLHFRMQNVDEIATIDENTRQYVGDTGIQFYLADTDPEGNPHSGIIRIDGHVGISSDNMHKFARPEYGGSVPWDNERYINVWVSSSRDPFGGVAVLGWAYPRGYAPDEYIGVHVAQETFGPNNTEFPQFQGKTLTHELGHFFGLLGHTNQDTHSDANTHANLPCSHDIDNQCKNKDIGHSNFMQLTPDQHQRMFSQSQVALMREFLEAGPLKTLYLNNLE